MSRALLKIVILNIYNIRANDNTGCTGGLLQIDENIALIEIQELNGPGCPLILHSVNVSP